MYPSRWRGEDFTGMASKYKMKAFFIEKSLVIFMVGLVEFSGCKPARVSSISGAKVEPDIEVALYLNQGFASSEDYQRFVECQELLRLYDRTSGPHEGRCTEIGLATTYECTFKGIKEKFQSKGVLLEIEQYGDPVQTYFKGFLGFEIDQCGEVGDEPVVALLRFDGSSAAIDTIEARFLCKTGSKACLSSQVK
jgi:hypothetical protein